MAERQRIQVAAGQKHRHQLAWGDATLGARGHQGSLEWSVVVLEELTVDLEVSAQLAAPAAQEGTTTGPSLLVLLQEVTRGRTFRGSFDPSTDSRLANAAGAEGAEERTVEAIVFEFNNEFSWWTEKHIELVSLRVRPSGPPLAMLPPLLAPLPLEVPPRGAGHPLDDAGTAQALPSLATPPPVATLETGKSGSEAVQRFAAHLDEWLALAEAQKPSETAAVGPWLGELLEKVAGLRTLCQEARAKAEEAKEAAGQAQREEEQKEEDKKEPAEGACQALTWEVLQAQDDKTSGAIIECLQGDPVFEELARKELREIVARDQEDGEKLQAGVELAVNKGVLPSDLEPPSYEQVDVMGKSADRVADEILHKLPKEGGCVVILVGLSGTGKGTTVDKLKQRVRSAATWSNGNCFRALTLLAVTFCEQQGKEGFDPGCLTPENLAGWSKMLEFGKYEGKFDIRIKGLGLDVRVSEVANTLLKEPKVSKNIPTVAKETQGEVVKFAGDAVRRMGDDGCVVLLEGREQTLNFISSPHRFCLTMADTSVIGARRAAQRIAALVAPMASEGGASIAAAVRGCLAKVVAA